jgi:hypothetical protein
MQDWRLDTCQPLPPPKMRLTWLADKVAFQLAFYRKINSNPLGMAAGPRTRILTTIRH